MGMFSTVATRMNDGVAAEIDRMIMQEADLVTVFTDNMRAHPRGLKKTAGPSELGHPCSRYLIHSLMGNPKPGRVGSSWPAQLGTWDHAGTEQAFNNHPINQGNPRRWETELKVTVGEAAGYQIQGTCDLYDRETETVIDWKFVSPTRLLGYQSKGPGPQYRTQIHLYGRGVSLLGWPVRNVMIAFMPRGGDLGTGELRPGGQSFRDRGKRYFWSERYDESVALKALSRLDGLSELLKAIGPEKLLAMYPACSEFFCPWCGRGSM
jgi:hypothetical protein